MGKVYRSYYLRPQSIICLSMIIALTAICWLAFLPDENGAFVFTMLLFGWAFYVYELRPLFLFKKFVRNLTPAEKELFADSAARYKRNMKFWDSDRFWITNFLTVVDAGKIVWLHPVINGKKQEIVIYQYGSPFKQLQQNPAKPLIPISFPDADAEQVTRHILKYRPDVLRGYTKENVDEVNRKYGAKIRYQPDYNDIGDIFGSRNNKIDIGAIFGFSVPRPQAVNIDGNGPFDFHITEQEAAKGCTKSLLCVSTCDKCNGSGDKNRREPRLCKDCNGTGRIKEKKHILLVEAIASKECKSCKGRGRIVDDPCDICKGMGGLGVSVEVRVPAGIKHGEIITVSLPGSPGRDMTVKVKVT